MIDYSSNVRNGFSLNPAAKSQLIGLMLTNPVLIVALAGIIP